MAQFVTKTGTLDFGFTRLDGELAEVDRQLAWEIFVHLSTRVSLRGSVDAQGEDRFRGEVLAESFEDIVSFLELLRRLAARYPAGRVEPGVNHLGAFMTQMSEVVIRPLLLRWKAEFDHWWSENKANGEPFAIQNNFPYLDDMLDDWIAVRRFARAALEEIAAAYGFFDLTAQLPAIRTQLWGS